MAEAWCDHFDLPAEIANCANCKHGGEIEQEQWQPPRERKVKPRPKLDPFMAKVEAIASGNWCEKCDTPVWRGMCQCQREARFGLHRDVLTEWARHSPEDRANRRNRFIALGGIGREMTRAGLGSEPMDGLVNVTRRQAVMTETRDELDIAPSWTPFRNQKADEFPMPA